MAWRAINDYGIRIDYRTYDSADLGPWRLQHSGVTAKHGLWEVHYDPYDLSQVFVRTRTAGSPSRGRTCRWSRLRSPTSPGGTPAAWPPKRGLDDTNETDVARVLDDLLTRAQAGPADRPATRRSDRVAARTKVAAAAHRPPSAEDTETEADTPQPTALMTSFGIFDAHAEAEKWI